MSSYVPSCNENVTQKYGAGGGRNTMRFIFFLNFMLPKKIMWLSYGVTSLVLVESREVFDGAKFLGSPYISTS